MNEIGWAVALAAAILWTLRPRPPARRIDVTAMPASTGASITATTEPSTAVSTRRRRGRTRTGRARAATLPLAHWCEGLARAVRGGDNLHAALGQTPVPTGSEFAVDLVRRRAAGRSGGDHLDPDAALVAAVVATCLDHGGPSAEPLDRAAGVLRARAAERSERRVQSAQARLSAVVLTWLPIAMLGLLALTSENVRRIVVSPVGAVLVVLGGGLNLAGWWWMRRIIERASR